MTSNAIAEGRSTREDVLFTLGEPDRRGFEDRWFAYQSVRSLGGVALVITAPGATTLGVLAQHEKIRQRLLVIDFDARGVVAARRYTEALCGHWRPGLVEAQPCSALPSDSVHIEPGLRVDAERVLPLAPDERVHDAFLLARCRCGAEAWRDGAAFITGQAIYFLAREADDRPPHRLVLRWRAADVASAGWDDEDPAAEPVVRIGHVDGSIEHLVFQRLPLTAEPQPLRYDRTRAQRFIDGVRFLTDPLAR